MALALRESRPPSTVSASRVTNAAASESSHAIALATSAALPIRPIGTKPISISW
jgi:hypothetical protein